MDIVWVAIEMPLFSNRWRAHGTDPSGAEYLDELEFTNRDDCDDRCEYLNNQQKTYH